jgi:ATP-binding protein involved in chromosome partitioning
MAHITGLYSVGVIENMSYFRGDDGKEYEIFGSGGGGELAETLQVPLVGQIPIDPALREFADVGAPIVMQAPDSEVAQSLDRAAKEIVNLVPPKPKPSKRIHLPVMPTVGGHQHS